MNTKRKYIEKIGIGLTLILAAGLANASTLHVKNDTKAEIEIMIEPGEGTVLPNKETITYKLQAGAEKEIEVTKDQFKTDTFSVTGKGTIPSLNNKCGPLNDKDNYTVIFTPTTTGGVECISKVK